MPKIYVWGVALLMVLGLTFMPFISSAATFQNGENVTINEETADDLYVSGGTITINQPVRGDLNAVGGILSLADEAVVEGDLNAAGGQIWANAPVGDDVHVAGGNLTFSKEIGDDLFIFGGNILVTGNVKGDVYVAGGTFSLDGIVEGNVHSVGGQFIPGENMQVKGDLDYVADEQMSLPEGATVEGAINYTTPEEADIASPTSASSVGFFAGTGAFLGWALPLLFLLSLVALFIWTMFIVFAAPLKSQDIANKLVTNPWKSLGCGVLFLIVTPIASIFLLLFMVTFPIGILGFILYGLGLLIAPALFAFFLGAKIMPLLYKKTDYSRRGHLVLASLLGALIYSLVMLIPFIGPFVIFVGIMFALGSLCLVVKPVFFKPRNWTKNDNASPMG